MSKIKFEKEIVELINNRRKIPDEFWQIAENGQRVLWILNREDGTAGSYETSAERMGVTKEGLILWGYSSGCSCWSGWSKDDYKDSVAYKEFALMDVGEFEREGFYEEKPGKVTKYSAHDKFKAAFSKGWQDVCYENLKDLLMMVRKVKDPLAVLNAKNAEVRRYMMKRVGYKKIRAHAQVKVLHTDGTSELLDINGDHYVKVKDSSTDREYLLYVPINVKTCREAIAWTFGLGESEYNPIIET